MFKATGQLFSALFSAFSALDKGAKSLDHLASIAEAEALGLSQTMELERTKRLKDQSAALGVELKEVA